ncbi:hypothetical protein ACCO45_008831 [Purpureocillium lilacinum]|uniref:Uncharacterized protein n=1 Tax=Purpureocillium lilacinum TaxID=33203 RepID=A0ACC4DKW6_PURLI
MIRAVATNTRISNQERPRQWAHASRGWRHLQHEGLQVRASHRRPAAAAARMVREVSKASPGCAVPFRRSATTATPPVSRYVVGRCIISKQKLQRAALPSGRSIAAFTGSDVTPWEALELQQSSKFRRVRCCDVGGSRRWPCISYKSRAGTRAVAQHFVTAPRPTWHGSFWCWSAAGTPLVPAILLPRPSRQFQQGRGANVTCKTQHDPGPGQGPQLANSDDWSEKRRDWLTARPLPPAIGSRPQARDRSPGAANCGSQRADFCGGVAGTTTTVAGLKKRATAWYECRYLAVPRDEGCATHAATVAALCRSLAHHSLSRASYATLTVFDDTSLSRATLSGGRTQGTDLRTPTKESTVQHGATVLSVLGTRFSFCEPLPLAAAATVVVGRRRTLLISFSSASAPAAGRVSRPPSGCRCEPLRDARLDPAQQPPDRFTSALALVVLANPPQAELPLPSPSRTRPRGGLALPAMAQSQYGTAQSSPSISAATPAARPRSNEQSQPPRSQSQQRDADADAQQNAQHKRVYQACIPCRRRKVRCDLGSVDNPHDPPCVRCRRESKECYFSATRRKRKTDDGEGSDADEYVIRNGRKRLHAAASPPPRLDRRFYSDVPLTPGGSHGRSQPLRRPDGSRVRDRRNGEFDGEGDANQQLENLEAQTVMRREMYGPHDALDLLYKAATDRGSTASGTTVPAPQPTPKEPTGREAPRPTSMSVKLEHQQQLHQQQAVQQPIDPDLAQQPGIRSNPGYLSALRAWSRFRFVRAGWFTSQEAIEYIDYYYKYLSPMTPISPPTFSDPSSHITLLTEEPILTVTLLTIASRYRQMPGTGGHCRSHAIPDQLWNYLRGMIERCLWGQEAFGGGFCGSGGSSALIMEETDTSSTAPWRGMRKGSLRTLGTIESLLILTEWHPRALHFPPQEATDELMLPDYDATPMVGVDPTRNVGAGFGGKRIESWLEPAWRSDRMCWMLLSTAMGLAYELGVFDDIDEMLKDDAITRPEFQDEGYRTRANRIKRLLLIYTSQLAGRLGWTSMTPEHLRKADPAVARRRTMSSDGATPSSSSLANGFNYVPDLELDDQIIHCWAGISNAMHLGNEKLFRSRQHTTEIIQTGKYVELLREFAPMLRDWYREFELFRLPQFIRHILTIEYEYVRIYVNSLSLQAVVERCTNNAGNTAAANGDGQATNQQLSPQTMINYGKLPLGQLGGFTVHDQEYVREVVDGCRNLLRTVVEGLLPGGYLKHAPVRTYFRIISGAMFLLKTFALGAPRSDVKLSIDLMDATVEALRNCVVDDVHLGIRFADLLETLTSRLRNRFIQAPTMQQSSGRGQSPQPEGAGAAGPNGDSTANWVGGHA